MLCILISDVFLIQRFACLTPYILYFFVESYTILHAWFDFCLIATPPLHCEFSKLAHLMVFLIQNYIKLRWRCRAKKGLVSSYMRGKWLTRKVAHGVTIYVKDSLSNCKVKYLGNSCYVHSIFASRVLEDYHIRLFSIYKIISS